MTRTSDYRLSPDQVRRIARESVAAAQKNAPLSGGHYRRLTLEDLTQAQRAAVEAARSLAARELGLSWFEVVPFVPLTPAGVEDVHATISGQCRFDGDSAWVRVGGPRSMARTVLHEARHLWQGRTSSDAPQRYAANPEPLELDCETYADRALAHLLSFEHNARYW